MLDNKELAKKYGLDESHFWKHPQAGKWIISHEGAMTIADHEGIEFSKPEYIKTERDLIVLYGEATIYLADGQTKTKWSHGEASHKNCFMPYPYAMAEKRLKDEEKRWKDEEGWNDGEGKKGAGQGASNDLEGRVE